MQTKEPDGVHRNGFAKNFITACHVYTGSMPLHIGIWQKSENPFLSQGYIISFGTVTCGIDAFKGGFHAVIHKYATFYFAVDIFDKSCVCTDTDSKNERIKLYSFSAFHLS